MRQNLVNTGAFEVSFEGSPIHSKLDTGRMPNLGELISGITEAIAAAAGGAAASDPGAVA